MGGTVSSCFSGAAERQDDTNCNSARGTNNSDARPPKEQPFLGHVPDTSARSEIASGREDSGSERLGQMSSSAATCDAAAVPQGGVPAAHAAAGACGWHMAAASTTSPPGLLLNGHTGLPCHASATPRSMLLSACTPCAVTIVCLRTGAVLDRNSTSTFYFGSLQRASASGAAGWGHGWGHASPPQYGRPGGTEEPPLLDALFSMQPEMLPEMLAAVGAGHIWEASMRVPAGSLSPPLLQLPLAPHVQLQHERPHRRPSAAPTTSKALLRTVEEDLNAEAFATVSGCNNLHAEDFHADAIVSRGGGEVLTSNDDDLIVMGSTESNVIFKLFDEKEDSRPHYEAAGAARGGVLVRSPVQRKRSASMAGESLGSRLGSDGCVMPSSDSTSEPQQGSPGVRGLRKSLPQDIMAGPEDYVSAPHALAHAPHRQLSMAGHSDFVSAPHAHTPRRQLSMAGHEDHASAPHAPAPAPNHQRAWSPGHSTHLQDAAGGHAMMHRSMSYTKADSVTISKITRASGMLPSKLPVGTSATQVSSMAGAAGWGDAADGSSAGTAAVDMPQKRLQSMLFLKHRIMSGSLHTIDDAGSASPVSPNSKSTVAALGRRQSSHFMPIGSQGGSPAVRRVGVGSPGESFSHQHTRPLSALNESNRVKLTGSPAGGTASLAGTGDGSGRAGRHSLSGHSQTMRTSTPATQHLTSSVFSSFGGLAGVGGGSGGGPSSHVATGLPSSSVSAGSCRLPTTAYTSGNGCPPSTSTSAFSARHSTGGETMGLQLPKRDSVQASGAMVVRRDSMQRKDSGHLVGMDPVPGQVVLARETPTSGATFQGPNHRVLTTATSFDMLQCLLERNSSNEGVGGSGGVRLRRIPPHVPSITQLPPQPPAAPAAKPTAGLAASEQQQQPQARRKAAAAAATPRSPATPAPPATPVAPNAPSSSSTPAGPMPMPAQSAPLQQQHGHTGGDGDGAQPVLARPRCARGPIPGFAYASPANGGPGSGGSSPRPARIDGSIARTIRQSIEQSGSGDVRRVQRSIEMPRSPSSRRVSLDVGGNAFSKPPAEFAAMYGRVRARRASALAERSRRSLEFAGGGSGTLAGGRGASRLPAQSVSGTSVQTQERPPGSEGGWRRAGPSAGRDGARDRASRSKSRQSLEVLNARSSSEGGSRRTGQARGPSGSGVSCESNCEHVSHSTHDTHASRAGGILRAHRRQSQADSSDKGPLAASGGAASLHGTSHMQLIASAALMSLDRAGSSRGALGGGGDDEARSCELPQEFGSAPSAGSPLARVATHSGPLMTIKPNYQRRPGSYVGGLQGEGSNDEPHYTTLSEVDEYENDYEDEEGGEEDEQQQVVCFHKVTARPALDPETGEPAIVLAQTDVTEQCLTEDALQALARAQLTILSQGFPRHIVEFFSHMGGSESLPSHMGSLARYHRNVSILFMDFVGFTAMSKDVEPHAVLTIVNDLFTRFDDLCDVHGVQKVDTAGDSYIVACGVMTSDADGFNTICSDETVDPVECAHRCMAFATDMLLLCKDMTMPHNGESVQIRVGIHTGDCVSGLVGSRLPKFSLFGDTMNTASRMESTGRPGHVHVSESTWALLGPIPPSKLFVSASAPGAKVGEGTDGDGSDGMDGQHGEVVRPLYTWELTGGVAIKGKGVMQTYLWAPPLLPPHATDAGEHTDTSIEERSGGSLGSGSSLNGMLDNGVLAGLSAVISQHSTTIAAAPQALGPPLGLSAWADAAAAAAAAGVDGIPLPPLPETTSSDHTSHTRTSYSQAMAMGKRDQGSPTGSASQLDQLIMTSSPGGGGVTRGDDMYTAERVSCGIEPYAARPPRSTRVSLATGLTLSSGGSTGHGGESYPAYAQPPRSGRVATTGQPQPLSPDRSGHGGESYSAYAAAYAAAACVAPLPRTSRVSLASTAGQSPPPVQSRHGGVSYAAYAAALSGAYVAPPPRSGRVSQAAQSGHLPSSPGQSGHGGDSYMAYAATAALAAATASSPRTGKLMVVAPLASPTRPSPSGGISGHGGSLYSGREVTFTSTCAARARTPGLAPPFESAGLKLSASMGAPSGKYFVQVDAHAAVGSFSQSPIVLGGGGGRGAPGFGSAVGGAAAVAAPTAVMASPLRVAAGAAAAAGVAGGTDGAPSVRSRSHLPTSALSISLLDHASKTLSSNGSMMGLRPSSGSGASAAAPAATPTGPIAFAVTAAAAAAIANQPSTHLSLPTGSPSSHLAGWSRKSGAGASITPYGSNMALDVSGPLHTPQRSSLVRHSEPGRGVGLPCVAPSCDSSSQPVRDVHSPAIRTSNGSRHASMLQLRTRTYPHGSVPLSSPLGAPQQPHSPSLMQLASGPLHSRNASVFKAAVHSEAADFFAAVRRCGAVASLEEEESDEEEDSRYAV